jgi:hypothetical protein
MIQPLAAFAGIWTEFKGDRGTKSKLVPGPHLVYGFLTTSPNAVDLLPDMPSFISRVRSGFGPCWGGLQTRSV